MHKLQQWFSYTASEVKAWMSNYISDMYGDVIIDPCHKLHVGVANLLVNKSPWVYTVYRNDEVQRRARHSGGPSPPTWSQPTHNGSCFTDNAIDASLLNQQLEIKYRTSQTILNGINVSVKTFCEVMKRWSDSMGPNLVPSISRSIAGASLERLKSGSQEHVPITRCWSNSTFYETL